MPSDDESDASNVVSEFDTQFVPRSDDDDVLWEVQEITAERGKKYKVKWAGTDPATGKPWAQSWVPKHDCTDDLVIEWKKKKMKYTGKKKRGGRTSTMSRTSGSSKHAGSSTSAKKTRTSMSEATTSRLDSLQEEPISPLERPSAKRKRESETPATTTSGAGQVDERSEPPRPVKKQKTTVEILLPPISSSSSDDSDSPPVPGSGAKRALQNKGPLKRTVPTVDESDTDDSAPPKAKSESARSKGVATSTGTSDTRDRAKQRSSKAKVNMTLAEVFKERVASDDAQSVVLSQEDEPRQVNSKKKPASKHILSPEPNDSPSESEAPSVALPIKIGPPRGVKRQQVSKASGSASKPGPSRTKLRKDSSVERVRTEASPPSGSPSKPVSSRTKSQKDNFIDERARVEKSTAFGSPSKPGPSRTKSWKDISVDKRIRTEPSPVFNSPSKLGPSRIKPLRKDDFVDECVHTAASPAPNSPSKPGPSRIKPLRKDDSVDEHIRTEATPAPNSPSKPEPPRISPLRKDDVDDECVHTDEFPGLHGGNVFYGEPLLFQDTIENPAPALPSLHIPIPEPVANARPRSPDLSPGTRARLELFDIMVSQIPEPDVVPPADVHNGMLDDTHANHNDTYHPHDDSDQPRLLSSPSKLKLPEPDTPNGLVVPETESSGNSQVSQPLLQVPPSPQPPLAREPLRQHIELPTITVITAPAASTSPSPVDLLPPPQRIPPSTRRLSKRPAIKSIPHISPNTFRSTINDRPLVAGEAPPSSIESFTSPKRVDKGKQRVTEDDQLQSSLSEREGGGERRRKIAQKKITDSGLRKRGKELFDQVQRAQEAERQKQKKPKRLKAITEIVTRAVSSPSKGSPLPFTGGADEVPELRLDEVIDLTGGTNSATLDTAEYSQAKPVSKEETERLRIELREEEEESTQEAMGVYLPLPAKEPESVNGGDAQMPPPRSSEQSPFNGQLEDVDHRSADLQLASVIVQPSQEQRHEDTDIEPSPANRPTSSPARPIPENLTDSPKRRLGEALSLLNVKSEEIQRLERDLADERKNLARLEVELVEVKQSSEPTGPVRAAWDAERAQWTQERSKWEGDLATWETQRKEWGNDKADLTARVAELQKVTERAEEISIKLSGLEAERDVWTKEREAMLNDMTQRSEELAVFTKARGENDQDRLRWEAERTSWAEEKAKWETERAALQELQEASSHSIGELTAMVASLTSAKVSAEKDRDFFREQYVQASAFVNSVRDENDDLEKRVAIAEGQAQEGVAAVKAFYEGRTKALQADVARWKVLAELVQEKDRRTNDEVRLRAAQTPELVDLCGRLTAENKSLGAEVRRLGQVQQRSIAQRNKHYREIIMLKKERRLRSKLRKGKATDKSTQEMGPSVPAPTPSVFDDPDNVDPNDMGILPDPTSQSLNLSFDEPALFPCMWRPQWRDQCQHTFDAKEDLERHMQEHFQELLDE